MFNCESVVSTAFVPSETCSNKCRYLVIALCSLGCFHPKPSLTGQHVCATLSPTFAPLEAIICHTHWSPNCALPAANFGALQGNNDEEARRRFLPMNCIAWNIGHLASMRPLPSIAYCHYASIRCPILLLHPPR